MYPVFVTYQVCVCVKVFLYYSCSFLFVWFCESCFAVEGFAAERPKSQKIRTSKVRAWKAS